MSDWLDLELSEQLAPVAEPDELWMRIQNARTPVRRAPRVFSLPVAAAATLILAGALWFMARGQQQTAGFRPAAAHTECALCHTV
jgi:hypothetical protein